jgi:hypothetical protein
VEPATRLRIHLTAVKGTLTGEKPLWESMKGTLTGEKPLWELEAEALTLRDELREADPWYRVKMQDASPTDGLLRGRPTMDRRIEWTHYVPADREVRSKLRSKHGMYLREGTCRRANSL